MFYKDTSNNVQTIADKTWVGTVTNVSALTIGTTGTDLSSTVANSTSTPVITLNVPTASASNRGALSSTDWSTFNNKAPAVTYTTGYIPFGQGTTTPNQSSAFTWSNSDFLNINTGNTGTTIRSTPAAIFKSNGTNTDCNIRFSDSVSYAAEIGQQNGGLYATTSGVEQLRITPAGNVNINNGNLVIGTSGKGIDFSATPGTGTSELLADYEEGTWTATISDGTTDATMLAARRVGTYTKVGRQVTVHNYVATTSMTGVTGNLRIKGLPFTVGNSTVVGGAIGFCDTSMTLSLGQVMTLQTADGVDFIAIRYWNGSSGTVNMVGTQWGSVGEIGFTLTYFV